MKLSTKAPTALSGSSSWPRSADSIPVKDILKIFCGLYDNNKKFKY